MKRGIFAVPVLAFLAAFGAARPASAQGYLYDTSLNFFGSVAHTDFTEPAILTSLTTVTSFTVATTNQGTVVDEIISPTSSTGSCPHAAAPCFELDFSNGVSTEFFSGGPYTSPGVYGNPGEFSLTITPLAPVPEPSSIVPFVSVLGAVGLAVRKRLRGSRSASARACEIADPRPLPLL